MPRVNVKKTIRNTIVEYSIPTIKDKKVQYLGFSPS